MALKYFLSLMILEYTTQRKYRNGSKSIKRKLKCFIFLRMPRNTILMSLQTVRKKLNNAKHSFRRFEQRSKIRH